MTENKMIRDAIRKAGIPHWRVAEAIGIHPSTFSIRLRHELPEEERETVLDAIDRLCAMRKAVSA